MIKRTFAVVMAALVAVSFCACGSVDESVSGTSSKSTETSNNASSLTENSSLQSTASNDSSSENSSYTYELSDLTVPDAAGPLLKSGLNEFLNTMGKDKYYLKYSVECLTESTEGEVQSGENIVVRDGDKISSTFTDNITKSTNKQIVKDNKGYTIDDNEKTVTWTSVESNLIQNYTFSIVASFYIDSLELCGSGKEKLNGKEYDYEEYKPPKSESSEESSQIDENQRARYYFDDGKLVGLKNISGDYYYTKIIITLNDEIPEGEFDYPSDYKLEESSETTDTSAE